MMIAAIEASGLGKQYRRTWALRDCTLAIPGGRVAGLAGPNGAGKTTLPRLATGMLTSTRGTISKLTVAGLTAMAVTEGLSPMQAWRAAPLGRAVIHGAPAGALYQGRFTQHPPGRLHRAID